MNAPSTAFRSIPAYALYGESADFPEGVHVETIHARSAKLDWRIGAHRHAALYQAILIGEGAAAASIEGQAVGLPAGSLAWVPPLIVHAYDFAPGTAGIVVSVPAPILAGALAGSDAILGTLGRPIAAPQARARHPAEFAEADLLFTGLLREFSQPASGRHQSLAARALLLALWFTRESERRTATPAPESRSDLRLVRAFLAEVESCFAQRRDLASYAAALGASVSHLSRGCRTVTGRSPLRLIHDRRLIEAKRHLVYTALPVGEIAFRLGFESPGYFSRFFRERTGRSPLAFRQAADGAPNGKNHAGGEASAASAP